MGDATRVQQFVIARNPSMQNESVYRLSLAPKTAADSVGTARATLEGAQQQLGFVPNMYARMANAPGLLETYTHGYQVFRQSDRLSPVEQEVIFLSISIENGCRYCVAAHSVLADVMSHVPAEVTQALRSGAPLPDAKLQALSKFTQTMVRTRGNPSVDTAREFLAAGYSELHILDIVLAIAVKTISNYSNHLFHTPVDTAFTKRAWTGIPRKESVVV